MKFHTSYDSTQTMRNEISNLIDSIINEGLTIMALFNRDYSDPRSKIVLSILLRRVLEALDGISILIKSGSITNTKLLMRSMLELLMDIKYILMKDSSKRAGRYLGFQFIDEDEKFERFLDGGEEAYKEFEKEIKRELMFGISITNNRETVRKNIDDKRNLYSTDGSEFFDVYSQYKKTKNPPGYWFKLFDGPKNIFEYAIEVDMKTIYNFLYSDFSQAVHGRDFLHQWQAAKNGKAGITIHGLRLCDEVGRLSAIAMFIAIRILHEYVNSIPGDNGHVFHDWVDNNIVPEIKRIIIAPLQP
jgi:hypothetical protein